MKQKITFYICCVIIFPSLIFANQNSSPRLMGTARTFTALSRGLDAMGTNPANLALDDRGSTVTFHFLPLGFRVGSDIFRYDVYNKYFTGTGEKDSTGKRSSYILSDEDKSVLKDEILYDNVSFTQANAEINFFGLNVQSGDFGIGFSVQERIGANLNLDKGYIDIVFSGLDSISSNHSLSRTLIRASWLREYNFSTAYNLTTESETFPKLALGVGVKYIQGFAYFGTQYFAGNIIHTVNNPQDTITDINNVSSSVQGNLRVLQFRSGISLDGIRGPFPTPAGKGIGIDIGITAKVEDAFYVAASLVDIGRIKWEKNPKVFKVEGDFYFDGNLFEQVDSLQNFFKGEERDTTTFFSFLPTALHLGGMWSVHKSTEDFSGELTLAMDVHIGFNDEPGNSRVPRISFGAEYIPIGFFALRTGFLFGGRERFNWSIGTGLRFGNTFDIDIATENIGILLNPNSFHSASISLGMRWRI